MKWTLAHSTFEIRFTSSYTYWDRTGAIANRLSELAPDLRVRRASPDDTVLKTNDGRIAMSYGCGFFRLTAEDEGIASDETNKLLEAGVRLIHEELDPRSLKRLGCRLHFHAEMRSVDEARSAAEQMMELLGGRFLEDVEGCEDYRARTSTLRFEDDDSGIQLNISTTKKGITLNGAADEPAEFDWVPEPVPIVKVDVDKWTTATLAMGAVHPIAAVEESVRFAERTILAKFK